MRSKITEDTVKQTYKEFLEIARQNGFKRKIDYLPNFSDVYFDDNFPKENIGPSERLYQKALQILNPYTGILKEINNFEIAINVVNSESESSTGLYLSALFNYTDLRELVGKFDYDIFGYRLLPSRKLIALPHSTFDNLGCFAEGLVINYGLVSQFMASDVERGVQINFGSVKILSAGVKGGVQINFGDYLESIGGTMGLNCLTEPSGGVQANFGEYIGYGAPSTLENKISIEYKNYNINKEKMKKLETKLREIEHFKNIGDNQDEVILAIKCYDWENFEEEVLELSK